jgi:flavorubredoxin
MISIFDKETERFENLWPIPNGVSYNVYLIVDDKITLVDAVDDAYMPELLAVVREIIGDKSINYLVINHLEPDHSGGISRLSETYPSICLIGNNATFKFIKGYYGDFKNKLEVKNLQELNTGSNTMQFFKVPMVHWPETMFTYLKELKILFTCDFMGSFGMYPNLIEEKNIKEYVPEINRYFVNVLSKYIRNLSKALDLAIALNPDITACGHGVTFKGVAKKIIQHYKKLIENQADKRVVVVYGTMYGNTRKLAQGIHKSIQNKGVDSLIFDISETHLSYLLTEIYTASSIVIATPTYNKGIFPPVHQLLHMINHLDIQGKIAVCIGSKTWSGGVVKQMHNMLANCNWQVMDSDYENLCAPWEDDYNECNSIVSELLKAM